MEDWRNVALFWGMAGIFFGGVLTVIAIVVFAAYWPKKDRDVDI